MKVLHVAAEVFPLIKTGGLADVAGALPPALQRAGADIAMAKQAFVARGEVRHGLADVIAAPRCGVECLGRSGNGRL